jgi:hypothetical protein
MASLTGLYTSGEKLITVRFTDMPYIKLSAGFASKLSRTFIARKLSRYASALRAHNGSSNFKGCCQNIHGLESHSARGHSVPHAKPSDFTEASTDEEISDPACFTYVYLRRETS